jgi:hypothetical protein
MKGVVGLRRAVHPPAEDWKAVGMKRGVACQVLGMQGAEGR